MSQVSKEEGILVALANRLVNERLPKALAIKERVDRGEVLSDLDLAFLEQVFADVSQIPAGVKEKPQFQDAAGRMIPLYNEIMTKALENEKAKKE